MQLGEGISKAAVSSRGQQVAERGQVGGTDRQLCLAGQGLWQ